MSYSSSVACLSIRTLGRLYAPVSLEYGHAEHVSSAGFPVSSGRTIHLYRHHRSATKIMAVPDSLIFQSKESNGSQILYIYKSNTLRRKTDSKIKTGLYTFNLHEIIFLARPIHSVGRGSHTGNKTDAANNSPAPACSFHSLYRAIEDHPERWGRERFLVSTPVAAQAAHQKKFLRFATRCGKRLDQVSRILGIDTIKVPFIKCLRQSGVMDHIIPRAMLPDKISQLDSQ